MKRLIDKIRFIKTFPKTKSGANENFKAHMSVASSLVCKDGLKPIHGTPFQTVLFQPYKGKTAENSLRLTFGGNKGGSYIAVECTPYKLTADEWMDACGYMTAIFGGPEVISKTFQLFEVELAIDIPQPMTDFIIKMRCNSSSAKIAGIYLIALPRTLARMRSKNNLGREASIAAEAESGGGVGIEEIKSGCL